MKVLALLRYYSFGLMAWLYFALVWVTSDLEFGGLALLCLVLMIVCQWQQIKRNRENGGTGPIGTWVATKVAGFLGRLDFIQLWAHEQRIKADNRLLDVAVKYGTVREIEAAADKSLDRLKNLEEAVDDEIRDRYTELLNYYQDIKDNASSIVTKRVFGR